MTRPFSFSVLLGTLLLVAISAGAAVPADWNSWCTGLTSYVAGQDMTTLRKIEQAALATKRGGSDRRAMAQDLAAVVTGSAAYEARLFAARLLGVVGDEAVVPTLAKLLSSPESAGLACVAFSTLDSSKVDAALLEALPTATGSARTQLAVALGQRRTTAAVDLLAPLTRDPDSACAAAAMSALARIASPRAAELLAGCRTARAEGAEAASLELVQTWIAAGRTKEAQELASALLSADRMPAVRRGAFAALLRTDRDLGVERSLAVLKQGDRVLLPLAVHAAASHAGRKELPAVADALRTLPVHAQVWGLDALSLREDREARQTVAGFLASKEAPVRIAALAAVGRLGDADDVRTLLECCTRAESPEELTALAAALTRLRGGKSVDRALVQSLETSSTGARVLALQVLTKRRATDVIAPLLQCASDTNVAVSRVAWTAISRLGQGRDAASVLAAVVAAPPAQRSEGVQAVQLVLAREQDPAKRAAAVLPIFKSAEPAVQTILLPLLPICGEARSLEAVLAAAGSPDASLKDAGLRALAAWPDVAAWDALVKVYTEKKDDLHAALAWRALTRLLGGSNAKPDAALVARGIQLLEIAASDQHCKEVLGPIGDLADPAVLAAVRKLGASRPSVRAEADAAAQRIEARLKAP